MSPSDIKGGYNVKKELLRDFREYLLDLSKQDLKPEELLSVYSLLLKVEGLLLKGGKN
jgi:hypothetical protein